MVLSLLIINYYAYKIKKRILRKCMMMTKKPLFLSLVATLLLLGCYDINGEPPSVSAVQDENCDEVQPAPINAGTQDGYVSYTEVAGDYKAYGERTPRDQRVGTSGPASNMSSAVPPTIEEEVASYEEEIIVDDSSADTKAQDTLEDPVEDWLAEEGMTLKELLTQWSDRSGWRLVWNTNRNYTLTAGAMFRARFADASSALIRAFARARPAPIATFYKGNRVLVVETMEDENAYE